MYSANASAEKLPAQIGTCASDGHACGAQERACVALGAAHLDAIDDEPVVSAALLSPGDDLVPLAVVVARRRDDTQILARGRQAKMASMMGVNTNTHQTNTHHDLAATNGYTKVGGADGGVDGVAAVPAAVVVVHRSRWCQCSRSCCARAGRDGRSYWCSYTWQPAWRRRLSPPPGSACDTPPGSQRSSTARSV